MVAFSISFLVVVPPSRRATWLAMLGLSMMSAYERAIAWLACTVSKLWLSDRCDTSRVLLVE